jgi:hypothetical protein
MHAPIVISSPTFAMVFCRFELQVEFAKNSQGPFQDFQSGLAYTMEHYKEWLYLEARRRLKAEEWKIKWIGSGQILTCVLNAIEIYEDKNHRNNIVEWQGKKGPGSRSHLKLIAARDNPEQWRTAEKAFWDMYVTEESPEQCFEQLVALFGARYDLISYLFFIRDWNEFVPVKSSFFPEVFDLLEVPLPMVKKCNWQNYAGVLARLREVQLHLRQYDIPNGVRLIDAHSFCWMLNCLDVPVITENADHEISQWTPQSGDKPIRGVGSDLTQEELELIQKNQKRIGDLAQAVVLNAERSRLLRAGRSDLASLVEDVSHKVSLGYDIHSFMNDGMPKPIEVKAAAMRGNGSRFFLSENELRKATEIPNYHFVLVFNVNSKSPQLREFKGTELPADSLHPINYEVRLCNTLQKL